VSAKARSLFDGFGSCHPSLHPTPGGKPSVMLDKASGVFGLLSKLDGQYRAIEGKLEQSATGPVD
jgi:hypothetical protein